MKDEDKIFEILGGYPHYYNLIPKHWIGFVDKSSPWWKRMCGDFPSEIEFRRRIEFCEKY